MATSRAGATGKPIRSEPGHLARHQRRRVSSEATPGVFGVDVQRTRTAIMLLEDSDGVVRVRSVGDGARQLIPTATGPDALWASLSADHQLAAADADIVTQLRGVDADTELAHHPLFGWCSQPWQRSFLAGMRRRLFSYLGQTDPTHADGFDVCVAVSPDERPAAEALLRHEDVGLTDASTVDPADALVCRWLAWTGDAKISPTALVAVSCGDTRTRIKAYQISDKARQISACGQATTESCAIAAATAVARKVLGMRREGVFSARQLLALLDGVGEFASTLPRSPADESKAVEWVGPLTDRMFGKLRLSVSDLTDRKKQPWIASTIRAVTGETARLVTDHHLRAPAILVGGIGATWPFIPAALTKLGQEWSSEVWVSPEPAYAIAVGAAHWPQYRARFIDAAPVHAGPAQPSDRHVDKPATPGPGPVDVAAVNLPSWWENPPPPPLPEDPPGARRNRVEDK